MEGSREPAGRSEPPVWRAWAPTLWSAALAVLMLGPALGPGYLLVRDMVWVPDLSLGRADVLGWGSALPRAVPSDAVVAVLDEPLGGHWLAIVVLLAALIGAGSGAAALVGGRLSGQLVAASVAVWSPFVVERLGIGHWPILLGYAAVPWLALAGRRLGAGGRWEWWVVPVLAAGSLSANAGIVSALTLLVTLVAARPSVRRFATVAAVTVALNAPWIVAGLAHGVATTDRAGFDLFRTGGDALPAALSVLTLGGIWNSEVVPDSRQGVAAWSALAFLVLLAVLGARRWARSLGRRQMLAHLVLWDVGVGLAILSAAVPQVLASIAEVVPGVGLFRDGSRSLALTLPVVVGLAARGSEQLLDRLPRPARLPSLAALALVPVALMPDAAWGLGRALDPVPYPASWLAARAVVGTDHGDAVVLPAGNYRAPSWNGFRPVIDPMGRLLRVPTVIDDDLVVDDLVVPGEDPRVRSTRAALALPTPAARAAALRADGIGWVVVEAEALAGTPATEVEGTVVLSEGSITVLRLDGHVIPAEVPVWRRSAQAAAWIAALVVLMAGPSTWLYRRIRGRAPTKL